MSAMYSERVEELEERLSGVDSSGMREHVEAFPEYFRDAAGLEVPDVSGVEGVAVAGMGGSGIGGELFCELARDRLDVPVVPVHDYTVPRFVDGSYLFVTVSYSGNTEETLSAHGQALERGCETVALTSGGELMESEWDHLVEVPEGIAPRAALPYLLTPLLRIGGSLGLDIDVVGAAESLDDPRTEAAEIASDVHGSVPVVYGYGPLAPAAYRWKCQVNENAKAPAFWNRFPELNHNEAEGWSDGPFLPVLLRSNDEMMEERIDATAEAALPSRLVELRHTSGLEGVLSAVWLGDWVSLYLAALRGVDPTPVDTIERVKELLS